MQKGISYQWSASHGSLTGQTFTCRLYYRPQSVVFCPCNSQMQPICGTVVLTGTPYWLPKLESGFSCNKVTSKQNQQHRAWGLFISIFETGFTPSLLSRNNRVRRLRVRGCLGSESMLVGCGSVILQVAHRGLTCHCSLPITPTHVHLQNGF